MLICITMYNENKSVFEDTLNGIYKNLKKFKSVGIPNEDIAVIVLVDGITSMHPTMLEYFEEQDRSAEIPEKRRLIYRRDMFNK